MFRRITTKWVLAVLASVVVPFVGFAWYVDVKLAHRLSWDVVRYYLLSLADDRYFRPIARRGMQVQYWEVVGDVPLL